MHIESGKRNDKESQAIYGWISIIVLGIFLGFTFLIGAGRYLPILFPLCSFGVGLFLYKQCPPLYIGFTLWLMFLSPEIRRLIDYQSSSLTAGPWNFVPFLVASISLLTTVKYLPRFYKLGGLPFLLCFGSVLYSYLIGLIQNPITSKLFPSFLNWFSPIALAFYLTINFANYPIYQKTTQRTFFWGVIVMGIYGLLQFLVAPEWDAFFLINTDFPSFGKPEPFGIRVWSTMEAPHTFATAMMAGLLLLFSHKNIFSIPVKAIGYLAFLLTLARTVWLSWLVGFLAYILYLRGFQKIRVIVSVLVVVVIISPLMTMELFTDNIIARLQTLSGSGVENDLSLATRAEGYSQILDQVLWNIMGKGLGTSISIFESELGPNDSTILPMLLTFGWIGIIPYFSGIFLILYECFQNTKNLFTNLTFSISIGILSQIGFNHIFVESMGMLFWFFMGMTLAGRRYALQTQIADL